MDAKPSPPEEALRNKTLGQGIITEPGISSLCWVITGGRRGKGSRRSVGCSCPRLAPGWGGGARGAVSFRPVPAGLMGGEPDSKHDAHCFPHSLLFRNASAACRSSFSTSHPHGENSPNLRASWGKGHHSSSQDLGPLKTQPPKPEKPLLSDHPTLTPCSLNACPYWSSVASLWGSF